MNQELIDYIKQSRQKGVKDETIKNNATLAGWDAQIVEVALKADLEAPAPPPPAASPAHTDAMKPVAVVHAFTTRGLEYLIMFIALGASAISLALLLHDIVNRLYGIASDPYSSANSYEIATFIVSLPIFAFLFLRLKAAELKDKILLQDPSRRHAIQLTLVITFLVGLFTIIGYIYNLINGSVGDAHYYGDAQTRSGDSPVINLIHTAITLVISGGIFAYYWRDSHRKDRA